MKRCPQCEFIYEDDQTLCDMDGILLVFDSQQLPKPNSHPHWKTRVVPALAAFVLATVLYLVYYVSTHQPPPASYSPAATTSNTETATPVKAAGSEKSASAPAQVAPAETKANVSVPELKASPEEKSKKSAPAPKVVKESNEKQKVKSTQKSQTTIRPKQDDSKISAFLKKTGRILKKPFKL
jgi:hypothetical protein